MTDQEPAGAAVPAARPAVLAAYADGVAAVEATATAVTDWLAPTPCPDWTARDLAGHLLAVARYYHRLLDAATAGRARTGLPRGGELRALNARDLAALPDTGGLERITAFASTARRYGERLVEADWELVLGDWTGVGPLTVGAHAGLAAGEWHIHAWDLARSAGRDHRPADPTTVATGRRALPEPLPAGDRWEATLAWAGRTVPRA